MDLTPLTIIKTFLPEDDCQVSRQTLDNVIEELQQEKNKANWIGSKFFGSAAKDGILGKYCCALLTSLRVISPVVAKHIRYYVYITSMRNLKKGKFTEDELALLENHLCSNDQYLDLSEMKKLCELTMTDEASYSDVTYNFDSVQQYKGFEVYLQIIIKMSLLSQGSNPDLRRDNLKHLLEFNHGNWPPQASVMLSSALVDLAETEEECERCLRKLGKCVRWKIVSNPVGIPGSMAMDVIEASVRNTTAHLIDPNDLPALFYHITQFSRKCNNSSPYVKRLVTDVITHGLDSLVTDSGWDDVLDIVIRMDSSMQRNAYTQAFNVVATTSSNRLSGNNNNSSSSRASVDLSRQGGTSPSHLLTNEHRKAKAIISSIVTHLSLLLDKDAGVASEVLKFVKRSDLLRRNSKDKLSVGKLLLCMLAARVPRQEDKILRELSTVIVEIYAIHKKSSDAMWYDEKVWQSASWIQPHWLITAFEKLIAGPLMSELLVNSLSRFAFHLLDMRVTSLSRGNVGNRYSLLQTSIHCVSQVYKDTAGPEDIGGRLLISMFRSCEYTRSAIVRDITDRLTIAGSMNVQSQGHRRSASGHHRSSDASSLHMSNVSACVTLLGCLVESCPQGLVATVIDLQEVFTSISGLSATDVETLILVLSPLLRSSGSFADRCALSLRKASFSRDGVTRQAAASALLSLMSLYFQEESNRSRVSTQSTASPKDPIVLPISFDETLSLMRRFLQYQVNVRILLYEKLNVMQMRYPSARGTGLQLLFRHLQSLVYYVDDAQPRTRSYHEECVHYADKHDNVTVALSVEKCISSTNELLEDLPSLFSTVLTLAVATLQQARVGSATCGQLFEMDYHKKDGNSKSKQKMLIVDIEEQEEEEVNSEHTEQMIDGQPSGSDVVTAIEACQYLWMLAQSAGSLEYDEFIEVDQDNWKCADARDECKAAVLTNWYEACSAIIWNLPTDLGGNQLTASDRMTTLVSLAQKKHGIVHIETIKLKERNSRKKKKKDDTTEEVELGGVGAGVGVGAEREPGRDKRQAMILHSTPSKLISVLRAHLCHASHALSNLFANAVDEAGASQMDEDICGPTDQYLLTRFCLEKALMALNTLLSMTHVLQKSLSDFSGTIQKMEFYHEWKYIEDCVTCTEPLLAQLLGLISLIRNVLPTEETKKDYSSSAIFPHLDLGQLTYRCTLGCVRVQVAAVLMSQAISNSSVIGVHRSNDEVELLGQHSLHASSLRDASSKPTPATLEHQSSPTKRIDEMNDLLMERLGEVLDSAVHESRTLPDNMSLFATGLTQNVTGMNRSNSHYGPTLTTSNMLISATRTGHDVGETATTQQERKRIIKKRLRQHVKAFMRLFVDGIQRPGLDAQSQLDLDEGNANVKKQRKKAVEAMEWNCMVVALIGEIIQPLTKEDKTKVVEKILEEAGNKIKAPSNSLSQVMCEFVAVSIPWDSQSRTTMLRTLADIVGKCWEKCGELFEQIVDSDDEDGEDNWQLGMSEQEADLASTNKIVCKSSLSVGLNCTAAYLENALVESDYLWKLRVKRFAARKKTMTAGGGTADGHISSDDEGDYAEKLHTSVLSPAQPYHAKFNPLPGQKKMIDDSIFVTLRHVMVSTVKLLPVIDMFNCPNKDLVINVDRVLGMLTRGLKLQVKISKDMVSGGGAVLNRNFFELAKSNASNVIPKVQTIIHQLQALTSKSFEKKDKKKDNNDRGAKKRPASGKSTVGKQSTIVPEFVYQLEQNDLQAIRLAKKYSTSFDFGQVINKANMRDFRFETNKGNQNVRNQN